MHKRILVLGAGRSSAALIAYLAEVCAQQNWDLTVGDFSEHAARKMTQDYPNVKAIAFDISQETVASRFISEHNLVVSLLPAHLHTKVAGYCLKFKKHLVTASYVSEEMQDMNSAAKTNGLLFLNECGLDPGIDHMSAMQVINQIRQSGGRITEFRSFTGGLIAPETEPENPWRYKFTWNSRNVVMAGQSVATFLESGINRRIPYQKLFQRIFPVQVDGAGSFDGYANRDSLKYLDTYGLSGISTMIRGTLRHHGFCQAWNVLVQLGCCDDSLLMPALEKMSHRDFIETFLPPGIGSTAQRVAMYTLVKEDGQEIQLLKWSGLFSDESIGLSEGTPAQILEHILNKRWKLNSGDKDQIVMWHQFVFERDGKEHEIHAALISTGVDDTHTAMARTVGLPLGIAAKLILENKINATGVSIPVTPEFYEPILAELSKSGIIVEEKVIR